MVIQADSFVTPRILPKIDSVTFYILHYDQIQELAHRTEDFTFLGFAKPEFRGDTAEVGIGSTWAYKRSGFTSGMGGGGCVWLFTRESGRWIRSKVISCVIS